jgi:hypothetical protein
MAMAMHTTFVFSSIWSIMEMFSHGIAVGVFARSGWHLYINVIFTLVDTDGDTVRLGEGFQVVDRMNRMMS